MAVRCKRCDSDRHVRNGEVRGSRGTGARICGLNFVEGDEHGKTGVMGKAIAMLLYCSGGVSYGFTTELLWVRKAASGIEEPAADVEVKEAEIEKNMDMVGGGPPCR